MADSRVGRTPARIAAVAVLSLVAAGAIVVARNAWNSLSGGTERGAARAERILLIGLDAADWRVLRPMMRRGDLPHLERLAREGRAEELYTLEPMISPAIWTSVATGRTPEEHGIHHFAFKPIDDYELVEYRTAHRRARAVWEIAGEAGRRVSVVDYMAASPATPLEGHMVSDLHSDEPTTFPTDLLETLDPACLTPSAALPPREELSAEEHAIDLDARLERTRRLTLCLLERERPDLFIAYTHTTDAAQHLFWKYAFPDQFSPDYWNLDEVADSGLDGVLRDHWRAADRWVGELVERAGDSTLTLIVSDHGATASVRPRDALRVADLLETMAWLSRDGTGELDPGETLAYDATAVPRNPAISLNVRGREPNGTVDPAEFDAVRSALIADLRAVAADDGTPLFSAVEAVEPVADGNSADTHSAHDIRCRLNDSIFLPDVRRAELRIPRLPGEPPTTRAVREDRRDSIRRVADDLLRRVSYSGKHRDPGVLIAHGPGVRRQARALLRDSTLGRVVRAATARIRGHAADPDPPVGVLDITPTLLWTLGLPVARDMAGKPATELFTEEHVAAHPVEWIESYEGELDPAADGEEAEDGIDVERRRYLRSLGYLN